MSRVYRIRVAESERRYIVAEDRVCTDIELLPILPPSRLSELLAEELAKRGYEVADGVAKRTDDDIELDVVLETGRVSARIKQTTEVEHTAETTVKVVDRTVLSDSANKKVRAQLRSQVADKIASDQQRLQREATAKLESKLRDLQQEVDEVSTRVAGSALKEKAGQLGEIVEMLEDETGSITIKVKV